MPSCARGSGQPACCAAPRDPSLPPRATPLPPHSRRQSPARIFTVSHVRIFTVQPCLPERIPFLFAPVATHLHGYLLSAMSGYLLSSPASQSEPPFSSLPSPLACTRLICQNVCISQFQKGRRRFVRRTICQARLSGYLLSTKLSHTLCLLISLRKSTPPQNRQLVVYYY